MAKRVRDAARAHGGNPDPADPLGAGPSHGGPAPALAPKVRAGARRPAGGDAGYVAGFPCITVTPFAFYGEQTAKLLQAVGRCLQSGKVDEVECCLLHALEPVI